MHNYSSLNDTGTHDQDEQAILFHTAETTRSKWTHIEDLDSFFTRMYKYHQKHGFVCMLLQEVCELAKFAFVVILTIYLFHGINYPILFGYDPVVKNMTKVRLKDVILPINKCIFSFTLVTWCMIIISFAVLVLKFLTKFYQTIYFWDIKQFYNTALDIPDDELDNLTWSDVLKRIKEVQLELQMCIHKQELTELDIYHRILRQENYMVAMANKHLLPPRLHVPFLNEIVYWTKPLRYNIQGLLFWSPWSPFESPWQLREEYKKHNLRNELANDLGRHILWLAFINLCLAPVMFLWQILYSFYSYGELIKREPGRMGIRNWSLYSRLYFRHFNELDHELHARLTRAYRPAAKYLQAFSSPVVTVIAQYFGFICGSLFTVIVALTIIDEDVIAVENVITIMTALGGITAICRNLIPDETTVWCPEQLLDSVVLHTHYLPADWKGNAHTSHIRENFQQLFQMSVVAILDNLVSPILTPYLMWRWVYPRSLDIVDFFRNFTVTVVGVGDVCSFAELDVKKHGNPLWQLDADVGKTDQYLQAEDGKLELSLVHFAATNPEWIPPPEAQEFIDSVQEEMPLGYDSDLHMELLPGIQFEEEVPSRKTSIYKKRATFQYSETLFPTSGSQIAESTSPKQERRTDKSVMWLTPSATDQEASRSFMALKERKKSVAWLEGPDITASTNMSRGTMVLQNRNYRSRLNLRSLDTETTPLLERTSQ